MESNDIKYVIFDLGGVLIDWNPEYLYQKVFKGEEEKMQYFLQEVCSPAWNMEQDAGRSLTEGTQLLVDIHPEYEKEIRMYYGRWEEMLRGEIKSTVMILNELKSLHKVKLYALTNWSAETFPIALNRFEFLNYFEGTVVSGDEKVRKPYKKIYEILLSRFDLKPQYCVFIDDSLENVKGAEKLGINGIHYKNSEQLRKDLELFNLFP